MYPDELAMLITLIVVAIFCRVLVFFIERKKKNHKKPTHKERIKTLTYPVEITYTNGSRTTSYCLGNSKKDAWSDMLLRHRCGVYSKVVDNYYIEFRTVNSLKLGEPG